MVAHRSTNANIFIGATPSIYKQRLSKTVARTRQRHTGDEQIVFINAWNKWAEGNHLEPDLKWGRAYLDVTRRGLQGIETKVDQPIPYMQQSRGGRALCR